MGNSGGKLLRLYPEDSHGLRYILLYNIKFPNFFQNYF